MRLSLIILCLSSVLVQAQDKMLTVKDAISSAELYPTRVSQIQWLPGGDYFSYLDKDDQGTFLFIQEIEKTALGLTRTIFLKDINAGLSKAGRDTLASFPSYNWVTYNELGFTQEGEFVTYNIETQAIKKKFNKDPKASSVVYADGYNGYAGLIEGGFTYESKGLNGSLKTSDNGRVLGDAVHRYEFGITNGLFFAPDANKLAYYDMNESMVTEYPLYDLSPTPAKAKMVRYPTAGAKSHQVSVYIRYFESDKDNVRINTGKVDDHYLTNIAWTPNSEQILIAEVNRDQNKMDLNLYSAATGEKVRTLFSEESERYVEPEHPAVFVPGKDNQFIWWSERDGYNHLYLYDLNGKLLNQITKGNWVVTEFHGFDKEGERIFITATKESPLERHLYCVDIKSGKMKKLTEGAGTHNVSMNEDGTYFIDQYSSTSVPLKTMIIDEKGHLIEVIKESPNPIKEYKLGEMEIGSIKGESGDDLYYRVFKPADFDPKMKYPVVVYLYNGPHVQLVTNTWLGGANLWYQYMAQQGFVVFTIDGRGSANRGFEFESSIHRNLASLEMQDQLSGIEWLKKQSYVDSDRIGIHGWSYGGYMTINLMTRHPGTFQVAVAGGPVIDWSLYEIMYTERYMDRPEENPAGYANTELKQYVGNLEGDLLIIHGAQDDVVLWQHSLQYIEEAIKEGVQLDYFIYPHHPHNVRGMDRVHLYEKISNYFIDNL
ncbi:prolyl oligopeptidase family serine peptidase [bacterium]|nr:prolyl oligopeptidase family serine peptidase [bacterium]